MLKKKLTNDEFISLANDLNLNSYIELNNLIEALNIEQTKETKICLVTTNIEVVESILFEYFDIKASLIRDVVTQIHVQYGDENYTAITEYGEMFVNKEGFVKILNTRRDGIECSFMMHNKLLKNIILNIIHVPEYNKIDDNSWRCKLLESDKLIMVLNASHILYTAEKKFIQDFITSYYSSSRLHFAIGNAQYIRSTEWFDATMRIKMQLNETFDAFPIFTEAISKERRLRYSGSENTFGKILEETQRNSLNLRIAHLKDLDTYKEEFFKEQLNQLKEKMLREKSSSESTAMLAGVNEEYVIESQKHITDKINIFIESPLLANISTAINEFSALLKISLKEDIDASTDIKQDARSITRYLSEIWGQFSENQNTVLLHKFEYEVSLLFDMMRLDLKRITDNINNTEVQERIKKKLENAFSVNTFFSRKTTQGNGLTDALTIGGVITGIVVTPLGWIAVLASEIIKIVGKESMNNEYKETLKLKIEEIIDKNKEDILSQAEIRFKQVSQEFQNDIIQFYNELLLSIKQIIKEEKEHIEKISSILETINSLI